MKRDPKDVKLEEMLRSSKLVHNGFMGNDSRLPEEVIRVDMAELEELGVTAQQAAERMRELTLPARAALGNWIESENKYRIQSEDVKGSMICPWPHAGKYEKRVTTCIRMDTGEQIQWTDLSIHMIEAHGFFEGKGSTYRIEPRDLVRIIFDRKEK